MKLDGIGLFVDDMPNILVVPYHLEMRHSFLLQYKYCFQYATFIC